MPAADFYNPDNPSNPLHPSFACCKGCKHYMLSQLDNGNVDFICFNTKSKHFLQVKAEKDVCDSYTSFGICESCYHFFSKECSCSKNKTKTPDSETNCKYWSNKTYICQNCRFFEKIKLNEKTTDMFTKTICKLNKDHPQKTKSYLHCNFYEKI